MASKAVRLTGWQGLGTSTHATSLAWLLSWKSSWPWTGSHPNTMTGNSCSQESHSPDHLTGAQGGGLEVERRYTFWPRVGEGCFLESGGMEIEWTQVPPTCSIINSLLRCRVAGVPLAVGVGSSIPTGHQAGTGPCAPLCTAAELPYCLPIHSRSVAVQDWKALTGRQEMDRTHSMKTTQRDGHIDTCVCWGHVLAQKPGQGSQAGLGILQDQGQCFWSGSTAPGGPWVHTMDRGIQTMGSLLWARGLKKHF
jgi:hypothetical protein